MRCAIALSCGLSLAGSIGAQQGRALSYLDVLQRMHDVDWLWRAPETGERCVQFSSYDRRSDAGPEDFDAWFANDDRGKYLRVEEGGDEREHVMVDFAGPGVLSRIWSANPSGELKFYVDRELVWTVDFALLCSGEMDPVRDPLAGVRARGANCYLPITFREHLKVTATAGDFYYQCNVSRLPPGTDVESFSPALLTRHGQAIAATAARLASGHPRTAAFEASWSTGIEVPARSIVRSLDVVVKRRPDGVDLGEVLRRVLLRVRHGREELVRVPVTDFFGGGPDWRPWRGYLLGVTAAGNGYSYWPMPLPRGGEVDLVVQGDLMGVEVELAGGITELPAGIADPLLFRASYHQRKGFDSRPFHDFPVLDATGRGRFVGCSLLVKNPTRAWWGEGDEKFWVDGEGFPSTFGTGTEDYFGYAWCSPEVFSSAFHAQTQCDGPANYGFTALHRSHVLDSVPFQRSFRFDMEVWHWVEELKLDYASVAYWYGAPGATSGLPPVPDVADRTLDRLGPPPVFVAEGVIEGEGLRVAACTGGTHEVQDMAHYENQFSRDGQRWWRDGEPGDTLVLAVPVAEAGRYRVLGAFCMAHDYGIVQMTLDDQKLGEPFDAYATRVKTTGKRELGVVELSAGEAMLRVTILGRHEKAHPAHMFGLDYLKLEKLL